uniref:Uncharacterized protein n=1 Tax=Gadus morhua TaxID=8049 RepID=A0A8C5C0M7_GADMO
MTIDMIQSVVSPHPFQWRNWTPQAMLYLKGASKLPINLLTLRLTKNGRYRTVIMICLNIRITTMGQIAMAALEVYLQHYLHGFGVVHFEILIQFSEKGDEE